MKVVCANFAPASNCRKMGRNDDREKGKTKARTGEVKPSYRGESGMLKGRIEEVDG